MSRQYLFIIWAGLVGAFVILAGLGGVLYLEGADLAITLDGVKNHSQPDAGKLQACLDDVGQCLMAELLISAAMAFAISRRRWVIGLVVFAIVISVHFIVVLIGVKVEIGPAASGIAYARHHVHAILCPVTTAP